MFLKNIFKMRPPPPPTLPPAPPAHFENIFLNIFGFFLYVCLLIYTYIYVSIYACHVYCQALVLVNEEEKFCRKSVLKK